MYEEKPTKLFLTDKGGQQVELFLRYMEILMFLTKSMEFNRKYSTNCFSQIFAQVLSSNSRKSVYIVPMNQTPYGVL